MMVYKLRLLLAFIALPMVLWLYPYLFELGVTLGDQVSSSSLEYAKERPWMLAIFGGVNLLALLLSIRVLCTKPRVG
jgi:hypothetical protein